MPAQLRNLVYKAGKCVDTLVLKVPFVNRWAWYALRDTDEKGSVMQSRDFAYSIKHTLPFEST